MQLWMETAHSCIPQVFVEYYVPENTVSAKKDAETWKLCWTGKPDDKQVNKK